MISKLILALAFVALVSSNLHLNVKYRDIFSGNEELTEKIAEQIYMEFRSPYFERSQYRFSIFYDRLQKIKKHNAEEHTWWQGINDFSDMTFEEFAARKLMAPQ